MQALMPTFVLFLPVLAAAQQPLELDSFSFYPTISSPDKIVLLDFYVPGCRSCKRLEPIWLQLAAACADEPDITIAKFNCVSDETMCDRFDVTRTPTIKLFHHGKDVMTYKTEVYHIDMLRSFVKKMRGELLGKATQGEL